MVTDLVIVSFVRHDVYNEQQSTMMSLELGMTAVVLDVYITDPKTTFCLWNPPYLTN